MPTKVFSFYITGKDETEIHGKRYRAAIAKLAIESNILGSVRNVKSKPEIEVRLVLNNKTEALNFINKLEPVLNKNKKEDERLKFSDLYESEDGDGKYNEFNVIREDELTEMVWALQGAGDVFLKSSQEILNVMINRDYKKERGLMGALSLEVRYIKKEIDDMTIKIKDDKKVKFHFDKHCMQRALVEPPWADNDEFMIITHELFYSISRNESSFESLNVEEKLKELEAINKLVTDYSDRISKRIEEIDKHIKIS
jgi:hypothetical protein